MKAENWSADFISARNSQNSKPIELIDVYLGSQTAVDSNTLFYNTSNYSIRFWPYRNLETQQNYVALGIERGGIGRSLDSSIDSLNVVLDNVSRSFSTLFATEDFRGKRIVIRQCYRDVMDASGDYDLLIDGVLDTPEADGQGNIRFEIKNNILESLNVTIPKEHYCTQCNNKFTDSKCANGISEATLEDKKTSQTIDTVTDQVTFIDAARTESDTHWVPGIIEMTGGTAGNIGLKRRIVAKSSTTLTIEANFPSTVVAGDEYSIERDCDKTFEECQTKFENEANFRGFKYLPQTIKVTQLIR